MPLEIQWPFSQLILTGAKTAEVRDYMLGLKDGRRNIVNYLEEMWLIETLGSCVEADTNALIEGACVSSRPAQAHIVGTISFDTCHKYTDVPMFRADETHHRIRGGGSKDWNGQGARYAWHVKSARKLETPIAISKKSHGRMCLSRSLQATFAETRV